MRFAVLVAAILALSTLGCTAKDSLVSGLPSKIRFTRVCG